MTEVWKDQEGKETRFDAIAFSLNITWEGTVDKAKLYMPLYIQFMIGAAMYPLKDLLERVTHVIDRISINYADGFELCFLARFQELFYDKHCPSRVLSGFFTERQRFGSCGVEQFADATYCMPKGMKKGTTANLARNLSALRDDMDKVWMKYERLNQKLFGESPGVLLLTMVQNSKLMVELAVKNYSIT
ncbi:hypothetical protein JG687_00010721 [Phytophthora cactorum]|uniref:Uncharacterized protein n=1 Tax=Phytophthora cactorum TaxID=29920 RepID=A0A329RND4_9STRA|nr:hypothetical protein Pcac1_g13456 [Phytophthora cactorum]KAG2809291.1 hypothetical protein PC112_g16577 [Phytophthora cactorum]KAG2811044.1 hypothetical protein PC111_g15399 [Phytophthora cactorum]KAG2851250.1 hypothetical protein PC113_g16085 [Phytophthora cactorum]KAG2889020.1 hypothetical protein PC114_g18139 [Phytophthora cactorum]